MVHEHDALLQKSLLPPADEVAGMYVMCSVWSVILFGGGEVPCDHYPWCIGTHHAGTPKAPQTSLYRDPLVLTSGGYWRTYSRQAGDMHPTGILSCLFTAHNDVWARLYFHRRLWFCSQGGGGVCLSACWDTPCQGDPPAKETPVLGKETPICAMHAGRYSLQAGGMHAILFMEIRFCSMNGDQLEPIN